jgi:hypothetical protein
MIERLAEPESEEVTRALRFFRDCRKQGGKTEKERRKSAWKTAFEEFKAPQFFDWEGDQDMHYVRGKGES